MGARIEWEIDPVREADKLAKSVRNKVVRIAMNKASAVVKAAVVGNAPSRYGYLKKSIRIKVRHYKNKAVWVSVIGPKSDYRRAKGKVKRGPKKGTPILHHPSNYARLVEQGTKTSSARPFLKPALQQTRSRFMETLRQSIEEQVARQLPKK